MRILEITLLIIVTILPFVKRPLIKIIDPKYIIVIVGLIATLHLLIEGWRWQMIPVYFLILVLFWRILMINKNQAPKLTFKRTLGFITVVLVLLPGWTLPNILPVFSLPKPTGKYSVGTKWIHLKTDIDETITADPSDKRELMIKVWYPSNDTNPKNQDPYVDQANRLGFIKKYSMGILPPSSIDYLDRVQTYAYQNLPIAEKSFPVLIFSHGYGSKSTGYYALLTEIASQGYIIFNMTHTYESLGATFPNGTMKFFDYEYQSRERIGAMKHIGPIQNAFKSDVNFEERHEMIREAIKGYYVKDMVKRWSKDMIYTMNQFEDWNIKGFFKNKLDLDKIGVFGHSRGGGAAGQVTITDNRIKAAANIDGVQWGEMIDTIYQKPFLYISADWPPEHNNVNAHIYINRSTDYFYESKLLQSGHPNFMDIPLMIPIKSLAETGSIDAKLGMKITTELVTSFFDKHLKNNKNSDPGKIDKKYELLQMNIYKGDSIR